MFVEVVIMTNNTQFKTLVNTWLNQKKPMITPSTHASFTLIAENHLIPYFGKHKIGSITEADIQSYISYLYIPHYQAYYSTNRAGGKGAVRKPSPLGPMLFISG